MATALAKQLSAIKAKSASVSTLDRKKRQKSHAVSLIYEPIVAAKQDLDSVYLVAYEGFLDLVSIDPRFRVFERSLFSETSITIDRHVQTAEQNAALDKAIESFLSLVASRVLLQPAMKALEWLVRRFKINEMNREILLLTFLPYHSHSVFQRILDVVQGPLPPLFGFFSNAKLTATPIPRNTLVRALTRDVQLFALVSEFTVSQVQAHCEYHTLLSFWTSISISVILALKDANTPDEVVAERFIPHISDVIAARKSPEAQTAAYMIIVVLVSQIRLSTEVLQAIAQSLALNWTKKSCKTGLAALTQVIQFQDVGALKYAPLDAKVMKAIRKIDSLDEDLKEIKRKVKIDKFVVSYILAIIEHHPSDSEEIFDLLEDSSLSNAQKAFVLESVLRKALEGDADDDLKIAFRGALASADESSSFRALVLDTVNSMGTDIDALELRLNVSIKPQDAPAALTDGAMEIDSAPALFSFDDRLKSISRAQVHSYLEPNASADFDAMAEVFLQGLAEEKPMSQLLSNTNLFPVDSDLPVSFLLRMAISTYPVLARIEALKLFGLAVSNASDAVDYQASIVFLLVALTDSSENVRRAAADCLKALDQRYEQTAKSSKIWGLESIYGTGNETDLLKWLGLKDLKSFVHFYIVPRLEEVILDKSFTKSIVGNAVDTSVMLTGEKKKREINLKGAVCAFLTSHIVASPFFRVKLALLNMLSGTRKIVSSLSALCDSFLNDWIAKREVYSKALQSEKIPIATFETALLKIVSGGDDAEGEKFLISCLKADIPGLSDAAGDRLVETWSAWSHDSQLGFIKVLINMTLDDQAAYGALDCLSRLQISTPIFSIILSEPKLVPEIEASQQSKRRRRRSSTSQSVTPALISTHQSLRELTLVLELLEGSRPETHSGLLKQLLSILGDLLLVKTDSSLPVQYTQQILVDCILPIIKTADKSQLDSNTVRIDIIVSCIRSSSSPQIQNKFLLLVAALASLSPEIVLHSVMPIFTFMGANTIRQDDEFSAHVIQQTISQVVPALALSTTTNDSFGMVELVLSFVNAFPYIPYHRRVKLFTTLTKTLGANESLALVLRLLAKRHYDLVSRNKTSEAKTLSEFADVFLRGFSVEERIEAVSRYVAFARKIPTDLSAATVESGYVADLADMSSDKVLAFKIDLLQFIRDALNSAQKRAQVAAIFKASSEEYDADAVSALQASFASAVETLLDIIASSEKPKTRKYQEEAYDTLDAVLNLLPIQDFVSVLERLISRRDDNSTVRRALVTVRSKFENDAKVNDGLARNSALMILPTICAAISSLGAADAELAKLGFMALDCLCGKFGAVEPDAFDGEVIELVIGDLGVQSADDAAAVSALVCLSSLGTALGARILAYLPRIVPMVMTLLEKAIKDGKDLVIIGVFMLVDSFVKRIPMFMASYMTKILNLVFLSASKDAESATEDSDAVGEARSSLLENVIAKVPTKQLLGALIGNWDSVLAKWDLAMIKLHLSTTAQVIEVGARKAITGDASKIFDFLLSGFDTRNLEGEKTETTASIADEVERIVIEIAMQVVLKLNDKVFRPLFVRTTKWAMEEDLASSVARRNRLVVVFKFCERLFSSLKSIVTSYYGYILDSTADLLISYVTDASASFDLVLWETVIKTLTAAFANDQEEFWQAPIRFDKMAAPLFAQLGLGLKNSDSLTQAIVAFAVSCASEEHYKYINKAILSYMKDLDDEDEDMSDSDDEEDKAGEAGEDDEIKLDPKKVSKIARAKSGASASDIKITAVKTLKAIYERLGDEWLSMLPQLVPVVAELLEDEDESVETEVRKDLVPVIEGVLGESLDRYLN
ncbi:hypothetical protein BZA70DRAFT_271308 [Myxozyma melibiosi]|uniref:U3 small nucleolar RNA-associated protein 10 n=1 Tax=Myxozyma melibiosi TaxID=54550 RepID=A0ABR1FE49_9ASCO